MRLTPPLEGVESDMHIIVHPGLRQLPNVRAVMYEVIHLFKQEAPRRAGQPRLVAQTNFCRLSPLAPMCE